MGLLDFNRTIDVWISDLGQYNLDQLQYRSDDGGWSLGQVYVHLIDETRWYILQMQECLRLHENDAENMSDHSASMFSTNSFPNERITGDPLIANNVAQPVSIGQLKSEMEELKAEMNSVANELATTPRTGKTRHPGLGYFSAAEWLQYAEMHMRHHWRQKARIVASIK